MEESVVDDFISKRLLTKEDKKPKENQHIEEEENQFELVSSITNTTIDNLKKELEKSNHKYRQLQKDYVKTKETLERHSLIFDNFKNWIDMLDLMLNEGKDAVILLRDQIEKLMKMEDNKENDS